MRIWDIFPYYNEAMIADIRMRHVRADFTVVIEANQTFSGIPKGINFPRIGEGNVIHVMAKNFSKCKTAWEKEEHQENSALAVVGKWIKDDDIVICSDVDEIPRREAIPYAIAMLQEERCIRLGMRHHKYRWNLYDPKVAWDKPGICAGQVFKELNFTGVRNRSQSCVMPDAGWHLYGMGTDQDFIVKAKATSHFSEQPTIDMIKRLEGGASLLDEEKENLQETEDFPPECTQYPQWFYAAHQLDSPPRD